MKDSAALSATVWMGALQAAATVTARHRSWGRLDPEHEARQILELAACIIKHLPRYDNRMQLVIAGTIERPG